MLPSPRYSRSGQNKHQMLMCEAFDKYVESQLLLDPEARKLFGGIFMNDAREAAAAHALTATNPDAVVIDVSAAVDAPAAETAVGPKTITLSDHKRDPDSRFPSTPQIHSSVAHASDPLLWHPPLAPLWLTPQIPSCGTAMATP